MSYREFSSLANPRTISAALAHTRQCIAGLTDTPSLDAQVLLAHLCGQPKTWIIAHQEDRLTIDQTLMLAQAIAELAAGVPLPYVIGEWEFYGRRFAVTSDVLIPRPETELLVETALKWLAAHPGRHRVAEAGTGSGCITVSVAAENSSVMITATDISLQALAVAQQNANQHEVEKQIVWIENDLLAGLNGPFDLILANLPYIPSETLHGLPVYMREPTLALDGGRDGLDLVRRLIGQLPALLAPGGAALLEIEAGQGEMARDLARQTFPKAAVELKLDLAGHHRLLTLQI